MKTSNNQISLFTEATSTSSPAGFLASHTPPPESAKERTMTDISGQTCLTSLEQFNHVGSWAKTFTGLLIGMKGWSSKRCNLTWKMQGTKYNRLYFRLLVLALPIEEKESGLLLTPSSVERCEDPKTMRARAEEKGYNNRTQYNTLVSQLNYDPRWKHMLPTPRAWDGDGGGARPINAKGGTVYGKDSATIKDLAKAGLLPTPQAIDGNGNGRKLRLKKDVNRNPDSPGSWRGDLKDFAVEGLLPTPRVGGQEGYESRAKRKGHVMAMSYLESHVEYLMMQGILPTPTARDWRSGKTSENTAMKNSRPLSEIVETGKFLPTPQSVDGFKATGKENQDSITKRVYQATGTTSQLNPLFVAEMMGFSPIYTLIPFLDGEENQSKPTETP